MGKPIKLVVVIEKGMLDEVRTDLARPNAFSLELIDMDFQDEQEETTAKRQYNAAQKNARHIIYP